MDNGADGIKIQMLLNRIKYELDGMCVTSDSSELNRLGAKASDNVDKLLKLNHDRLNAYEGKYWVDDVEAEYNGKPNAGYFCPHCGKWSPEPYPFCPNCGLTVSKKEHRVCVLSTRDDKNNW